MKTMSSIVVSTTFLLFGSLAAAQEVRYTEILLSPQKYVGKVVTMKGTFN
jgi:hypothetical protein